MVKHQYRNFNPTVNYFIIHANTSTLINNQHGAQCALTAHQADTKPSKNVTITQLSNICAMWHLLIMAVHNDYRHMYILYSIAPENMPFHFVATFMCPPFSSHKQLSSSKVEPCFIITSVIEPP